MLTPRRFTLAAALAAVVVGRGPAADPVVPRAMQGGTPPAASSALVPPADACAPACDPCPPACPPLCPSLFPLRRRAAECAAPTPAPVVAPASGPRIRVVVPPPIVTYKKVPCPPAEAPCPPAPCAAASPCAAAKDAGFGAAPATPTTTTVMVPYTYYAQVPTYGYVPHTSFGSVPTTGFGAVPTAGFGGVPSVGFGAVPTLGGLSFGAVQPAGFGGVQTASTGGGFGGVGGTELPTVRALLEALSKVPRKDTGFGAAPAADEGCKDPCKKELAELSARIDKLQAELTAFSKSSQATDAKIAEAITTIVGKLSALDAKVGTVAGDKSLADVVKDLNEKIEKLKKK